MKAIAKKNIIISVFIFLSLTINSVFAQSINVPDFTIKSIFNDNLSKDEATKLSKGEIVIRNIGNYKKISLKDISANASIILDEFKNLKPAYLAETIQIRPATSQISDEITKLKGVLMDVSNYVGIPYYSVRNDKWYDLYSSADVKSHSTTGNKEFVNADLFMEPFGTINTDITAENTSTELFYKSINTSKIKAYGFTCVNVGKLISNIYIFKYGNWEIIYGIGGADAPSIFFLQERIETSFINRITSFCTFMCKFLD